MAVFKIVPLAELGAELVLAPERHHPARSAAPSEPSLALGELVTVESALVAPDPEAIGERFLVLDTADVDRGFIRGAGTPVSRAQLGSAKKRLRAGDVLISRLRPYLGQVGLVDAALGPAVCSTEFYVLRAAPQGARAQRCSIACLVPFLLSAAPQAVLAASVEGAHHPRFAREVLTALMVPQRLLERRRELSSTVERAVRARRQAERALETCIIDPLGRRR